MRIVAPVLLCGLMACEDTTGLACTSEARASIIVWVRDSVSGAPIAAGATLVLQDGAFADSITAADHFPNDWALQTMNSWERPGTYSVTVRRPGYADWSASNVVVSDGRCHVQTVVLTARLQPAG